VIGSRLNLPNVITFARIASCPLIFWLAISLDVGAQFWAFGLFIVAGLSDAWDGYVARRYDLITDLGKLLDPFADKLLLASTLIPFYLISHRGGPLDPVPWWGPLPTWVLVVIFGREIFITAFRSYAARHGDVIPAGKAGKHKALLQMLFIGGLLLWYPLVELAEAGDWSGNAWWVVSQFLQGWIGVTLIVAIVLTVYSLLDYLWSYRTLIGIRD
jgi:CDP-diacylglycerol--glycerol-3-phosphate 3-phosphatidyltransferase